MKQGCESTPTVSVAYEKVSLARCHEGASTRSKITYELSKGNDFVAESLRSVFAEQCKKGLGVGFLMGFWSEY